MFAQLMDSQTVKGILHLAPRTEPKMWHHPFSANKLYPESLSWKV